MLFPADLPPEEWFDPKRRTTQLQRVKKSGEQQGSQLIFSIVDGLSRPVSNLAYPSISSALHNNFPGLRNLGKTCYLNAVLQCIFHCEPLASHLVAPAVNAGVVDSAPRDLLADYVASGVSTFDVISPDKMLREIRRHAGFSLGCQHDAAECLRQLLRFTGLGAQFCDSQADVVDDSVILCYAPEAAQVSASAHAVDARVLMLEAATGGRSLKKAPAALAFRVENTYEQGGEEFWVDGHVAWSPLH